MWCAIVVVAYFYVELAEVILALSAGDGAIYDVSLSDIQILFHVENCLFPVSILLIWRGGEHDWSLQPVKRCVKPGDEAMHTVRILHVQLILT